MHRSIRLLTACAALSAGCTETVPLQEPQRVGQPTRPSSTLGEPKELAQGIWSIGIDVDVPTAGMTFVRVGDDPEVTIASVLMSIYQQAFAAELQRVLGTVLRRNAHCTISALSVVHAREVWISDGHGGPMALPSGAIVILPCGGNEPLAKPDQLPAK